MITKISEDEYNAARATHMTSHALMDFMRCPLSYHMAQEGMLPRQDSDAYRFGRALHCLVLEGQDEYRSRYPVLDGEPVNPKTGQPYGVGTKTWNAWREGQPADAIPEAWDNQIQCMVDSLHSHEGASALLNHTGMAEVTIRQTVSKVDCQSRIDFLATNDGVPQYIVDLKTCQDLDRFERDARGYGYIRQMAFYRMMAGDDSMKEQPPVYLIAMEKAQPYRVGVWVLDDEAMDEEQNKIMDALYEYRQCLTTETWKTRYEGIRSLGYFR